MFTVNKSYKEASILAGLIMVSTITYAHEDTAPIRADGHAPIGVMGDHMHKKGEWMVSLRQMSMSMSGNINESDSISDDDIATNVANRFAGMPMMPPTLRIVPQDMTTDMTMLGVMYAPTDRVTLMLMANYISKSMELKTYQGMMGVNVLGTFNTSSSGIGDTKVGALILGFDKDIHHLHFNIGLSLPTGALDKRDNILTPMNMRPNVRLPYAMQLGSGTYDFEPGITYTGKQDDWTWGAQYKAVIRSGENDEGYTLGNVNDVSAWVQHAFSVAVSGSLRLRHKDTGDIDGMDSNIMGPVQTADPSNYGGSITNFAVGINIAGQEDAMRGHRIAMEYEIPVQQDVNGVQMEMDNMLTVGWQYAF